MGPDKVKNLLRILIPAGKRPLLVGGPGCGKTAITEDVSREVGADLLFFHLPVCEPVDLKGMPITYKNAQGETKAKFQPFGDAEILLNAKKLTVAFLDDLGQAPFSVQAAAMQWLHPGRINGHLIPKCVVFVGATNGKEHKAGVQGMLEPVKDRFHVILHMESEIKAWKRWAIDNGVNPFVIAFVERRPTFLTDWSPALGFDRNSTPRGIEYFSDLLNLGVSDFEPLKGCAGEAFATEFLAWYKIRDSLPSVEEILQDPNGAKVPNEPSAQFAVTLALSRRLDDKNAQNIIIYLGRMSKEYEFLAIREATRRDSELSSVKGITDWMLENGEVIGAW